MSTQTIRNRLAAWAGACAVATALLAPTGSHAGYVLTEFAIAGADSTALWDINNHGTMVGYSNTGGVATGFIRASDGTLTTLSGPAGALSSFASGISDTGRVVGSFSTSLAGPRSGFMYSGGSYLIFSIAGADETFLRGISPDGRYWSGYYTVGAIGTGFVFDTVTGTVRTVSRPDSLLTIAQGVTNAGVLVGSDVIDGTPLTLPGFTYDFATNTRTDVALAGAARTALRAIDESGVVAGWYRDSSGTHGFIGSASSYETIDFVGAASTFVEGSNDARWLVGTWDDGTGVVQRAFYATPVSTPGSLALTLAGLGALGWVGRRAAVRLR